MNKHFYVFALILLLLLGLNLLLPSQLNKLDGAFHYENAGLEKCAPNYPTGVCLLSRPFAINPMVFWLTWFAIIALLPVAFAVFSKNPEFLTGFFFFTGTFFVFEMYQVYAQVLMSFLIIFFLMEKSRTKRIVVWAAISLLPFLQFWVHNQQVNFMVAILVIELALFLKDNYKLALCLIPTSITQRVTDNSISFRNKVYFSPPTWENVIQWVTFYAYHFLVKNMLFVFSIPAIIHIWRERDLRAALYFALIICAAVYFWWYSGWQVYTVTRILMWLPIVLLPSFLDWLSRQEWLVRKSIWGFGAFWFVLQAIWYFLNKSAMVC